MDEDQGHLRLLATHPRAARCAVETVERLGLVDLDVQRDAVGGHHRDRARVQRAERDVPARGVADPPLAARHRDGGAGGSDADGATEGAEDPALGAHPVPPTYLRVIRPPMRVTIS